MLKHILSVYWFNCCFQSVNLIMVDLSSLYLTRVVPRNILVPLKGMPYTNLVH